MVLFIVNLLLDESIITLSFFEARVVLSISHPPIEADTVVNNPSEVIEELGVVAADGTAILSAVIAPCTV